MRICIAVLLGMISVLVSGCSAFVDSDEQRLCRSLLPALNADTSRFELVNVEATTNPATRESTINIVYIVTTEPSQMPASEPALRSLACLFGSGRTRGSPELINVITEHGPLAPLRLHVLQRHWIDAGLAAIADPAPINMLSRAPRLPHAVAAGLQQLLASLPTVAVYALLATAYSLIYGLVGRINLAFGDLSSLAGYGAFLGFSMIADGYVAAAVAVAAVAGFFTAAMHGGVLGRYVIAPLASGPGQHILIATIGISIVWQEAMRLAQGSGNRWLSPMLNRPLGVARADDFIVTVTPMTLAVAGIAAAAATCVVVIMRRSRFGLRWRACADDQVAAELFGINRTSVLVRTMVLAALLSGLGGILTTFYYGGVGYAGGLVIGLKALIAAIVGGIGSVHGALLGGLLLGLAETAWSGIFSIEYRDPAIFVGLAIVLWARPAGLFGDAQQVKPTR